MEFDDDELPDVGSVRDNAAAWLARKGGDSLDNGDDNGCSSGNIWVPVTKNLTPAGNP